MKKVSFYLLILAAGVFSACQKDLDIEETQDETPAVTELSFGIQDVTTKTDLYGVFNINWSAGDQILVNCKSGFEVFTLKSGAGTRAATFSIAKDVTLNNDGEYSQLSVYPATLAPAWHSVDGDHPTAGWYLTLPDSYDWSSTRSIKAPMRTYQQKESDLLQQFTMVTGVLKVEISDIPANADKLVFTAPDLKVSGELYMDDGGHTVSAVSGTSNHTITINFEKGAPTTKTFLIPVPAGTYTNFTIQFYDGASAIDKAGKKGTITVASNEIVYLPAFSCSATPAETPETILWEGSVDVSWSATLTDFCGYESWHPWRWTNLKDNTILKVYFVETDSSASEACLLMERGNWSWFFGDEDKSKSYMSYRWAKASYTGSVRTAEFPLNTSTEDLKAIYDDVKAYGIIFFGPNVTIKKISIKPATP